VPRAFYDKIVQKQFTGRSGLVYILPETLPLNAFFPGVPPLAFANAQQH
jgi:hypothetical protein